MNARLRKGLVAAVVGVAIAITTVGAAFAAATAAAPVAGGPAGASVCSTTATAARSAATAASLKAFADCEIGRRLTTLGQLSSAVGAAKSLTSSDASSLSSIISGDKTALTALKTSVDGASTAAGLRLAIVQIVSKYRIYELVVPQVNLTIAADTALAIKPHFDQISTDLAARIATAQGKGKDVTAAQADLSAMNTSVVNAVALASPIPAALLAMTPAGYGSGSAATLQGYRTALGQARDDLKSATQDARDLIAALK
jgi:hypothetical protein